MTSIVTTTGLKREYTLGSETVRALCGVDLAIGQGEFLALLGRSGSGKSTLLNLIGGLDRPTAGSIIVDGLELAKLSRVRLSEYRQTTIGFIFQSFNLVPTLRAWENVTLPLVFMGVGRSERKSRGLELLERVGLEKRSGHVPSQMSGGEQQRVAIARALVNDPKILLCDEPTGNLDTATSAQIMSLLNDAVAGGTTLVMVTHDPELAAEHATRTLRMADGRFLTAEAA
ncbi:ABC transporter ATP-binding protein [Planctomycetota bacterium]|nr:ABC transporter ATP-binding protein [Planctomycetota bacterium]